MHEGGGEQRHHQLHSKDSLRGGNMKGSASQRITSSRLGSPAIYRDSGARLWRQGHPGSSCFLGKGPGVGSDPTLGAPAKRTSLPTTWLGCGAAESTCWSRHWGSLSSLCYGFKSSQASVFLIWKWGASYFVSCPLTTTFWTYNEPGTPSGSALLPRSHRCSFCNCVSGEL